MCCLFVLCLFICLVFAYLSCVFICLVFVNLFLLSLVIYLYYYCFFFLLFCLVSFVNCWKYFYNYLYWRSFGSSTAQWFQSFQPTLSVLIYFAWFSGARSVVPSTCFVHAYTQCQSWGRHQRWVSEVSLYQKFENLRDKKGIQ